MRSILTERRDVLLEISRQAAARKAFCRYYFALGNPAEAARKAGAPPGQAEEEGLKLLQMPACRSYLTELAAQPALPLRALVLSGLARLAFGSANDAVRLVFADDLPDSATVAGLDLFHVSEIKRVKGGGVEIKLFDRQKALEKLMECAAEVDSTAAAEALLSALGGEEEGDGGPQESG